MSDYYPLVCVRAIEGGISSPLCCRLDKAMEKFNEADHLAKIVTPENEEVDFRILLNAENELRASLIKAIKSMDVPECRDDFLSLKENKDLTRKLEEFERILSLFPLRKDITVGL